MATHTHHKHIPIATKQDVVATMTQNTNTYSNLVEYTPVEKYPPISVYYTFVGAEFYLGTKHPVLKWASRDAFAEILYRHLYTAEQRDHFYAYLDIAYNSNRTAAANELLKDGRFMMAGNETLYVRNMYIYAADRVHSLGEHDIVNFSKHITNEHGISTCIGNMMRATSYSRADINRIIRVRYNNRPPRVIANLYLNYCNGLPDLPDIADVQAATHKPVEAQAPTQLSRIKSTANVRRAGVQNNEGTCTIVVTVMMFADIPEIYHECWMDREAIRNALPPNAETDTAKALTERYANNKFAIFPHLIATSVPYLNNRSNLKVYRDSIHKPFLTLTDYAVQYANSYEISRYSHTNKACAYVRITSDPTKPMVYKNRTGSNLYKTFNIAMYDLCHHFKNNKNICALIQPVYDKPSGTVSPRVILDLPDKSKITIHDYLKTAKTKQQYVLHTTNNDDHSSHQYPIRVRNDRTGTDYILISYGLSLYNHKHVVYVNLALRERVDNSSNNTTPSAMMMALNKYDNAYDSTDPTADYTMQSLPYATILLYRRCDTLPSQTI